MAQRKPLPDWARALVELAKMQVHTVKTCTEKAALDPSDRLNVIRANAQAEALESTLSQLAEKAENDACPILSKRSE